MKAIHKVIIPILLSFFTVLIFVCSGPSLQAREVTNLAKLFGSDIDTPDYFGRTQLMNAFAKGDYPLAESLMRKGANINAKTKDNNNMLMLLINGAPENEEKYRYMKFLITNGIDVNEKTQQGYSALSYATYLGTSERVVGILLEMGARVNIQDNNGKTPLMNAVSTLIPAERKIAKVKMLLSNGADPNIRDKNGATAIDYAGRESGRPETSEIIKLLIEKGATVNHKDNQGNEPLMAAVRGYGGRGSNGQKRGLKHGRTFGVGIVEDLLDRGANVNATDKAGNSPLIYAVKYYSNDNSQLIKLLISRGADVNQANNFQETSFSLAVEQLMLKRDSDLDISLFRNLSKNSLNNALLKSARLVAVANKEEYTYRFDMFTWLLSKGADINAVGLNGFNVLMTSAYDVKPENYAFIDFLLGKGISINSVDSKGRNILHFILQTTLDQSKITELVAKFINAGVNVNLNDNSGFTPLMLSVINRPLKEVSIALLKKGANINAKDNQGETVLIKVARKGVLDLTKLFIEHNADLNIRNDKGLSAIMCASDNAQYEIVKLLIDKGATYQDEDYVHVDASCIIEPKEGQIVNAGSKLRIIIQPQKNEKWLSVIYDIDLSGQKFMRYDKTRGFYAGEIVIPKDLKASTQTLEFFAVAATKDEKNADILSDFINSTNKLPQNVRFITLKRTIAIKNADR